MSKPVRKPDADEPDADPAVDDAEQFLREFRRRMAEQGLIVRMANAPPDWEPGITLDIPGDELSAMVVRLRRGEV
jgi:hypothetical protein